VHANKSFITLQIAAVGRVAMKKELDRDGHPFVSASDIPIIARAAQGNPRPLTTDEITEYYSWFATAARNAVRAGFDMVEIHGANGYLVDQFLQDVSNNRTDEYGRSVENRARFALGVVSAVGEAIGYERLGIRFSPWNTSQDMRMKEPVETFGYLITQLRDQFPSLAYIHLINPELPVQPGESNDFALKIWGDRPFLSAGGYDPESAVNEVEKNGGAVAIAKWFLSNPDLPDRIKYGQPLTAFDPKTFYAMGPDKTEGYIDYPLTAAKAVKVAETGVN